MAAKEEAPPPAGDTPAPKKSGKLKLIIIISVVLVVLIIAGVVAFLLLTKPAPSAAAGAPAPVEAPKETAHAAPIYMAIDPFTVNLVSEIGDQYLQVALTLDLSSNDAQEKARQYMPKLRNDLTVNLASQKPSELVTKEGKEKLAAEIRTLINKTVDPALKDKAAGSAVREVLFTSFIIQ